MRTERKLIVLVDDSPTHLLIGKNVLGERYTIATAPSAKELFLFLEENVPDLILLDIEMPGMDGFETIRILKAKPATRDIPVIFLSSHDEGMYKSLGLGLGAVDYITKPYEPIMLLERIETHLANSK